ncbi:hypothetical protein [Maridesulfovibrio salexigens]|uniref:Uncharacterized protein n=1 Tax=Maridesulfovibrio salexigens (strain ATCC 14822 / DSM 2638 / NCIMB 8403 / VKM B-1763) TaxID=526222 RepID=C6BVH6_MARSD|nr:hypothetical protein [Maridesulfovibrio salexigens]ACS78190.1 hypothetical protein Desal_0119 [Maridesulfovibrio salexigens DSM 2638]
MAVSIFDLGLSVEANSLFLLIEGMLGSKIDPDRNCKAVAGSVTIEGCLAKWNGEENDFLVAMKELIDAGILTETDSELRVSAPENWKKK